MDYPSILIPAYKPDQKMITLIKELLSAGFSRLMVVDDGGGQDFAPLFAQADELGCLVLHHGVNLGKGRALKTGLNYALLNGWSEYGIITADADGQHLPADIARIAAAMAADPDALILGVRNFTGKVPLKSRLGNGITRAFFALIHGDDVRDTQTGLRGLPPASIPLFLGLPGERYEYEMNMLLAVRPNDIRLVQVPIDTVYLEGNRSSHFKVLQDSARIYGLLIRFIASSLTATGIDYLVFILMNISFPDQLVYSVVTARFISSLGNYAINRNLVFKRKKVGSRAILRYYALVGFIMLANYGLIKLMTLGLGFNVYAAKVVADLLLVCVSFFIQREFVYRSSK